MDFAKRYPLLTLVLAVGVLAFVGQLCFVLFSLRPQAMNAAANLRATSSQLGQLLSASPAPTQANLAAAEENVAEMHARIEDIYRTLASPKITFPPAPPAGTTLVGMITNFVERLRAIARTENVHLGADNFTFGLGQYVGRVAPPPPDRVAAVYEQMQILNYILSQLVLNTKPKEQELFLLSVERENVSGGAAPATTRGTTGEIFAIDPLLSARVPDAIETVAFRISFVAYTNDLRAFLNKLAEFELPLVVRSIGVELAAESILNDARRRSNPALAGSVVTTPDAGIEGEPVVRDNWSKFTVTIEYIKLVPQASADAEGEPPAEGEVAPDSAATPADSAAAPEPAATPAS